MCCVWSARGGGVDNYTGRKEGRERGKKERDVRESQTERQRRTEKERT